MTITLLPLWVALVGIAVFTFGALFGAWLASSDAKREQARTLLLHAVDTTDT